MRGLLTLAVALVLSASLSYCHQEAGLPDPGTDAYSDAVSAFYAGLAGIEAGAHPHAEDRFRRLSELAPEEPAGWMNRGLLALRENRLDEAAELLDRARRLAPEEAHVYYLIGILERRRGRVDEASAQFRRTLQLDPGHLKAAYALVQILEQQERAEAERLLDSLLQSRPDHLVLTVERARLAAEQGDAAVVEEMLDRLAGMAGGGDAWPQELQDRLSNLREAAARNDGSGLSQEIAYLKNDFQRVPSYREQLADVEEAAGREGAPITRFVRLPVPRTTTADPDTAMYFTADSLAIDGGPWDWVRPLPLAGDRVLTLAVANGQTVKLGTGTSFPFPGGPAAVPPGRNGITAADCDNDYRADLVLAGEGGLRLYRQERLDTFNDVTAEMNLPEDVRDGDYSGVWAVDLDMDGDLDLVLSSTVQPTRVLGNDGDGTFTPWALFDETDDVVDFVWADLDGDEVPDAALLDASGGLHVYRNLRTGRFEALDSPSRGGGVVLAVTAADLDGDGRMELAGLEVGGAMARYSFAGGSWTRVTVARWDGMPESPSVATLFAADLDNNGGVDLLAVVPGGGQTWLADADGRLVPASISVAPRVFDVADLGGTGRLDLIGLSSGGQPVRMINVGVRNYASKGIQLRAERTTGDRRINSFGIGGTVEIRSGLLYQKRRITGPVVHFGLGERDVVDVARIIWPNGTSQVEFDLETDQTVLAQQRLKGSCPWIFTHDGTGMRFVTDFLWRTALGLRINAQPGTNVIHSVDWVKIDGDLLRPRNGFYDVRITAELWETHFFDHVALMTVDRPAGVGVFVDERFVLPAPDPELFAVAPLRSVAGAWDHRGRAVTDLVRDLDGRYLDTFDLGPYQGVAEPHFVEVALGDGAAESGPIRLVASGWVRPTDSSINLAVAQGSHDPPRGLRLDVPDGTGGWKTVDSDLGFPAGKSKTIVIDLDGVFPPDVSPRVRLHTNMEVYWDRIAWSVEAPQAELRTERIVPHAAELRYRGFSTVRQDGHSSPELPDYDALTATSPQWLDLSGYHTRLGDVSELVGQVDDRYVIMNAGDELALTFTVPRPPPDGWVRDFVLIGDGWVKDGDFNTGHSATVRPLPYHGLTDYTAPPGRLEDDPVFQRFPQDWATYHTRYVTPGPFRRALVPVQHP